MMIHTAVALTFKDESFAAGAYDNDKFYAMAKGMEDMKEGGARCFGCYALRLEETAKLAKEGGFDYFTTTPPSKCSPA